MDQRPKIIYIGDPMCSWCYGISDEIAALKDHYSKTADFELVMGGLRPYNKQKMIELKDFLTHHWEDVHKASGQTFNYGILDNTEWNYDTEPPSRATITVRNIDPAKEFSFFKGVQKLFYLENQNMSEADTYHPLLAQLDIDADTFDEKFSSTELESRTRIDFQRSAELGVRSFPTVLLIHDRQVHLIASGYASRESMVQKIDNILN